MTRRAKLTAAVLTSLALAACAAEPTNNSATSADDFSTDSLRDGLFTGHWTNWYKTNIGLDGKEIPSLIAKVERATTIGQQVIKARGLLKLGTMRTWLEESSLFDSNPSGATLAFASGPKTVTCGKAEEAVRTIDGTCNDLTVPAMGAAGTRFGRNSSPKLTFDNQDVMTPNPRAISTALLTRPTDASGNPTMTKVPFLNLIAASWIQFEVHDWLSHGDVVNTGDIFQVPLPANDEFRAAGMEILTVPKTQLRAADVNGKKTFYNENTHWWDGSQLYGSSASTANGLRAKNGDLVLAELAVDDNGNLPIGADGVEQTGFNKNWWLGLSMLHQVFASEHNQIVAMLRNAHSKDSLSGDLATLYPNLGDDDARYEQWLFDHARMINAAEQAKIHSIEWTPAILPNPTLRIGMRANWYGLTSVLGGDKPAENSEADKILKQVGIVDPGLDGIVGGKRDLPGNIPYSLTEEFTSVYRLHSLLPENLQLPNETVATDATRLDKAHTFTDKYAMADLFTSFGAMHPGTLTLHNFPRFMQSLTIPGFNHYDLGAVDVLRDRERGVPRYNAFREAIQLKRLSSIDEITTDPEIRQQLKTIYGSDAEAINRVDLLIGTLAEGAEVRPDGFGFGETMFQVFILMASRRLHTDRFFTTNYDAAHYTQEGLDRIQNTTFKAVLIRNYPQLASALDNVDNAFLPWDGSVGRDVPTDFPKQ